MTQWFRSDDHFFHEKVMLMRGFAEMHAYHETLIGLHNQLVKSDDIVWFQGDISMGKSDTAALELMVRMNGRRQLITGNHDSPFPGHRDSRKHQRAWLGVFESVQAYAKLRLGGRTVMLSHFPYAGDHTDTERYGQYRLRDCGDWLLHGHVHSDKKLWGPRQVHIGLDAWDLKPVNDQQVLKFIEECEGSSQ